jgi:hypothetical protein
MSVIPFGVAVFLGRMVLFLAIAFGVSALVDLAFTAPCGAMLIRWHSRRLLGPEGCKCQVFRRGSAQDPRQACHDQSAEPR